MSNGKIIWSKEGTTQGDPLGMAMYALGATPLFRKPNQKGANTTQIWFADDSAAAFRLTNLCEWWDSLGPCFGYEVNVNKCWLVVNPHLVEQAHNVFPNTGIQISDKGRPYLGAAIGQQCFVDEFVSSKVSGWIKVLDTLCNTAQSQPHAAYSALAHGVMSKWGLIFNAQFQTRHTYSNPWRKPFVTGCYHPSQAKQL